LPGLISVEDVIGHTNRQANMCPINITSEDLWGAIYSIGSKDGTAGEIATDVLTRLVELKIVKVRKKSGQPKLTKYGKKCLVVMESGDDEIPELDQLGSDGEVQWPTAIRCTERLPEEGTLVFAWKPIIEGWDIVVGREVINGPDQYTHWLPMMPRPE
jgi:hypothetical protein